MVAQERPVDTWAGPVPGLTTDPDVDVALVDVPGAVAAGVVPPDGPAPAVRAPGATGALPEAVPPGADPEAGTPPADVDPVVWCDGVSCAASPISAAVSPADPSAIHVVTRRRWAVHRSRAPGWNRRIELLGWECAMAHPFSRTALRRS